MSCVERQAAAHPSRALNVLSNVPSCVGDGPVSWLTVLHGVLATYLWAALQSVVYVSFTIFTASWTSFQAC
jgi:hypothetical protein